MKTINRPDFPRLPRFNKALKPNPINTGTRGDFGGSPVAFGASLSDVPMNSVSNLDTGRLQPKTRSDYWVDEIRFTALTSYVINAPELIFTGLAGILEAKFTTGQFAFSRDFIPLGLHGPRFTFADAGAVPTATAPGPSGRRRAYMNVRWALPKPLFMNAGDAVQCLIRYRNLPFTTYVGQASPNIEQIHVTYVGRLAAPGAPKPIARYVPWLAEFEKQGTVTYAATNDQLRNPFPDKDWHVQRFTSRTFVRSDALVFGAFQETVRHQGPIIIGENWTEARLFDSLGYAIVPEYTPINDVFDGMRGAWTFARTLGPREQFDLQLRSAGPALPAGDDYYTQVGVVGYREEGV
jgi:hypothetical protein